MVALVPDYLGGAEPGRLGGRLVCHAASPGCQSTALYHIFRHQLDRSLAVAVAITWHRDSGHPQSPMYRPFRRPRCLAATMVGSSRGYQYHDVDRLDRDTHFVANSHILICLMMSFSFLL